MKTMAVLIMLSFALTGCASASKKNHCPVAVIKVTQANSGYVGHK